MVKWKTESTKKMYSRFLEVLFFTCEKMKKTLFIFVVSSFLYQLFKLKLF